MEKVNAAKQMIVGRSASLPGRSRGFVLLKSVASQFDISPSVSVTLCISACFSRFVDCRGSRNV